MRIYSKKKSKKLMTLYIVLSMVCIQVFSPLVQEVQAEEETVYTATYTGVQKEPLNLRDGTYLFDNVTIEGTRGHPSAVEILGKVTIVLKGKSRIIGYDSRWIGDTQYASGAGIKVEKTNGYANTVTIQGDNTTSLYVKGGNANKGEDGKNGGDADTRHGGGGGQGGVGGNGASAAIGATGGIGGRSKSTFIGKDAGNVKLLGQFQLETVGGRGGAGGRGGNGGSSNGDWAFFWTSIASGGGGGGGGGGGYPAPGIGGGGGAGDVGGNGNSGEGTKTTTLAAFNESGGGGGGGARGWGAGGGGGTGFFAYYVGQPKYYTSIRPQGGKGGKSPTEYGLGGEVGIMECSQGGSGSGKSGGAYILRLGAYSGDAVSVDDKFAGAGYIETTRTIPTDFQQRRNGRKFAGVGARTAREESDWGGYGLDSAWAFIKQGGGETPEATNGGGAARRYEIWIRGGDDSDGGMAEDSKGGAGGKIDKSENVDFNPDEGGTGNGGEPDKNPGTEPSPVKIIIDLSHPDTKITFTPPKGTYDGKDVNPGIQIVSSTGIKVDPKAYTVTPTGNLKGPGSVIYTFTGKGEDYPSQVVVNSTDREYIIEKGKRNSYIKEEDDKYSREMKSTFSMVLENYNDDANIVTWTIDIDPTTPDVKYDKVDNGKGGLIIQSTDGTGKLHVKASISEGEKYFKQDLESITLYITQAGAEAFSISKIEDQRYTGDEITPPFVVNFGDKVLEAGKDYEFRYDNNVEVGRAKVIVVGIGYYKGEVNGYFNIIPADITPIRFDNADYTKTPPTLKDFSYTSFPKTSNPIHGVIGNKELVEGKDYLVTYSNLTEVGKVVVTIVGIGNYTGSTTLEYNILPVKINDISGLNIIEPEDVVYDKTEKKAKPRVIFNGRELEEGKDYTLSYENHVKAGEATVYVHGMGNFTSESFMTSHFTIKQRPIYVVPEDGQGKISGDKDPEQYKYHLDGVIAGDQISFMSGSNLERTPGDSVGNYPFGMGSMVLNYGYDDNDNYVLHMSPDKVNFKVKAYETDAKAIIRGEVIDKETQERANENPDTGWYNHKVEVVAPEGYLISRNCMIDDEKATKETSFWQPYFTSEDGDFSVEGQTYYLMKKPEKEGDAAHISQPKQVMFKQDSVNPVNRIEMNHKKIYTEYTKGLKFDTYFKDEVNMDIIASDVTSGVKTNQYYLSDKELSEQELKKLSEADWKDGSALLEYSLKLTDEMKKIAYVRTVDVAGNVTYVNTDGFIIDKTKPSITLDYPNENKWVADKDAQVKVNVIETLSGIDERYMDYHYEFKEDGKVSDSYLIKLDKDGNAVVSGLADGNYDFIVSAKDKAGNIETATKHIMIDTVTPLLEVKGNVIDYATSKDVDIQANVGASKVDKVYVQKKGLGQACDEAGAWDEITSDYQDDKKYKVDENGTYYFKYDNGAGLTSNIATISFDTIDKSKPVAEVRAITVSDNQTYQGAWTKDDVQVFFKNNTTSNLGDTKYSYRLKKDGDTVWGDWQSTTRKNDYEASILLSQSGIINIQMQISSAAGMSSDVEAFTVKIDKQNPTATVELLDKSWSTVIGKPGFKDFFNDDRQFVVKGKDTLSGVNGIQYILLKGNEAKDAYQASELEDLAGRKGGWSIGTFDALTSSIHVGMQGDDTYVIYAKVIDEVGNVRYVSSDGAVRDKTKPDLKVDKSVMKDYTYPVGTDGLWITEPFATLPTELTDTLAGADKLTISYNNNGAGLVSKEYDISTGSYDINELEDGIYDLTVQGYDKAKNMAEEIIKIRKDTVNPDVTLVADNVNIGTKKHVDIEPIVGSSGLKSLGYQYVLEGDSYDSNGAWNDITGSYASGYDVTAKGTLYVRVENNLGIVNIVKVTFENIMEAPVDIEVDTVNEDNELIRVSDEGWYPEISVRFYNNPKNVSGFIYEYHDGDGVWKPITADDEGYAYIKAVEGTTKYHMRITNPESGKTDEESITVHVDATKPTAVLTTTATNSRKWLDATTKRTIDYGLQASVDVELKDVRDVVGSSGLHEVQYYVLTAGKNKQLQTFPEDEKAIKKELIGEWLPVTNAQMKKLKNGEGIILETLKADQEYMVYVRVKDLAGNVRYISSDGITIDASEPVITTDYKADTWLTKEDQDVHVTIKDNLSGVKEGTYQVNFEGTEMSYQYHCDNRNGEFIIPANQLKNGTNEVTIEASDVAGNTSETFVVAIQKDTVKPVISIEEGSNNTHRVGIKIDEIGVSGIKSVKVTCDNGAFDEIDITSAHTEGIQIPRNGTYTFILVNNAGISSEPVYYTVDDLGEPPVVHVEGMDENKAVYTEGSWSSSPIDMKVSVEDVLIGKGTYAYSLDGKTWTVMNADANDEYWITQSENGEYNYQFRVTAPDGAMSDIVKYKVKVDMTVPEFTYEITPKIHTNKWVDVRIIPKTNSTTLMYSFDGGDTYQAEPMKRFISNGYVDMVVKNATGTKADKTAEIRNIDRLQPMMAVYENRISDTGMYTVEMEVNDAPENLDFIKTGIDQVFITSDNPYSETNVRTMPLASDYVLELKDNQHYETNGEFKAEVTGNTKDNYWIIATDQVGNYKIKSFRVNPQTNKPEEIPTPPQPNQPGDSGDIKDDIDNIIDLDKENTSVENLITREKLVNHVIDNSLRDLPDDSKVKKEILETLEQLHLSNEQRKQVKTQQRLLVENNNKYIYIWIPIVIIMGVAFIYYRYKKHKLDEEYEAEEER